MSTKLLTAYIAVALLAVVGLFVGVYAAYFSDAPAPASVATEPIVSIGVVRSVAFTYPQEGAFAITDDLTSREYRLRSKDVVLSQYVGKKVAVTGLPERWGESDVIEVQRLEVLGGNSEDSVFTERAVTAFRLSLSVPTSWAERTVGTNTVQYTDKEAVRLSLDKQPLALSADDFATELARTWQVEKVKVQGGEDALVIQLGSGMRAFLPFSTEKQLVVISIDKAATDAWPRIAASLRVLPADKPEDKPVDTTTDTSAAGTPTATTADASGKPADTKPTTETAAPADTKPVATTPVPEPEPSAVVFPPSHFDGWRVFAPASRSYKVYIHPSWYWAGAGEGDGYLYHMVLAAGSDLASPDIMVGDVTGATPTDTNATIGDKQVVADEKDGWLRWRFALGGRTIEVRARDAYRGMAEAIIFRME